MARQRGNYLVHPFLEMNSSLVFKKSTACLASCKRLNSVCGSILQKRRRKLERGGNQRPQTRSRLPCPQLPPVSPPEMQTKLHLFPELTFPPVHESLGGAFCRVRSNSLPVDACVGEKLRYRNMFRCSLFGTLIRRIIVEIGCSVRACVLGPSLCKK